MITAEYDRQRLCIRVSGHSGYDVHGKDIVCAGVSALVYSLALFAHEYRDDDEGVFIEMADNNCENRAVFDSFINGLKMISFEYPKNFSIYQKRYPTEKI